MTFDDEILTHVLNVVGQREREEDYKNIILYRKTNRHLKFIFTKNIYDYYESYLGYIRNKDTPETYFSTLINYLQTKRFDGITFNFGDIEDTLWKISELTVEKGAFEVFLGRLKATFQDTDLLLTASFSGPSNFFTEKYDFSHFEKCFDLIHLFQFCFDEWCWSTRDIQYAFNELNAATLEDKVDKLIEWGISPEKIVLGVNFGGPYAAAKVDEDINSAKITKMHSYNSICQRGMEYKWHESFDDKTKLYTLSANGREQLEKIVFGNSRAIANLMRSAVKRNLAGALGFLLEYDDFDGKCKENPWILDSNTFFDFSNRHKDVELKIPLQVKMDFPLLRTINQALTLAVDELEQLKKLNENPNAGAESNGDGTGAPQTSNDGAIGSEESGNQASNSTGVVSTGTGNKPGSASNFSANSIVLTLILLGFLLPSIFSL